MPRKPKHPCSYPGCPKLTDKRFCEEHEKLSNSNYEKYGRDKSTKKRYGRAWKRIRDKYAAEHPFCELCFERGIIVPTEEIHHKLPLSEGGTHDRSNLIALCKSCHSTIHAKRGDYWGRTMSGGHRLCADRSGDPSRAWAGEVSTGTAPRERRGDHVCKIAK